MRAFWIATQLIREAFARKWFLGLGAAMTLVLLGLMAGLQLEIVDGALAATGFFGATLDTSIRSAEVALRPVFLATAYLTYYGSILFGINACADFAPKLLEPGRVEHLIAQPLRRWELLLGTFLGVVLIMSLCIVYGAAGFTLISGVKSQVWSWGLLYAGGIACLSFATLYSVMLGVSIVSSSAALAALGGWALFILGVVASFRQSILESMERPFAVFVFKGVTALVPRFEAIADQAAGIAAGRDIPFRDFVALNGSCLLICVAFLLIAIFLFEQKDY